MVILEDERESLVTNLATLFDTMMVGRLTPKNRYRTPSRIAESRQRFRHICSKKRSWNGRMHDQATVFPTDLFMTSIGAFHRSSPVSWRNCLAFLLNRTGVYVSGTKKKISSQLAAAQMTSTQKLHLQSRKLLMKPPITGPTYILVNFNLLTDFRD